jgi:D-alanyl-D-alanine carboxypeptidase
VSGLSEAFERIGAYLELRLPHMHAAGAALAVTDAEAILGVVVRGFADAASSTAVRPATRFEIGSISKSFTAILALQEAEAGRLDLHAPVRDLLPWIELREPYGPITLHHLLTHSSGLPMGTEASADDRFAAWTLRLLEPGSPPGARFHYSNDAYKVAGLVVERAAGAPLPELLRRRILAPLGMRATEGSITNDTRTNLATGYQTLYDDRPPQETHPLVPAPWTISTSGDGSIVSSVVDMAAYMRMLLSRGDSPAGRVISEESFGLLTSRFVEDEDQEDWGYGYGLWVGGAEGRPRWKHSGGMVGYTAQMTLDLESGLGVVMLLNGSGDRASTVDYAIDVVGATLAGRQPPEVGPEPDPIRTPNASDYEGSYRSGTRRIELIAEAERLRLREFAAGTDVVLGPEQDAADAFLVPDPAWDRFWLRFGRDPQGRVTEAFHGDAWFQAERDAGSKSPPTGAPLDLPREWTAFVGHYRANNPWMPSFRIVLRRGRLVLTAPWEDEADPELVPLVDGSFRVGVEPWRPDRIRFDTIVEGAALRAIYNEAVWYRSFTP